MLISVRIIAGSYRSRTLEAPAGLATRPTSDRLRETLFNVLAPRIEDASFLDLYAGSGAVGIEALSRGAAHVVFVERAPEAISVLRANLAKLKIGTGYHILSSNVRAALRRLHSDTEPEGDAIGQKTSRGGKKCTQNSPPGVVIEQHFNLVFLDPPYDEAEEYETTLGLFGGALSEILAPNALVIAEHRKKEKLAGHYGNLQRTRLLEQGDAALSFYAISPPANPQADSE